MKKIFLGGTWNNSKWREDLIPYLKILNFDYFNPVVENWDKKAQEKELFERKKCDFILYVITPEMKGVYSIAEVVDDSNKRPQSTLLVILEDYNGKFLDFQIKSLEAVVKLVKNNGVKCFKSFENLSLNLLSL